jgi:threonine-phosphate decarboxylase
MIQGHGGNVASVAARLGCRPDEIVDMSSNINPLGVVPGLLEHLRHRLDTVMSLPEVDAGAAVAGIADILGIDAGRVLMGTGTTQFIYTACPALGSQKVLIVGPTYADYTSSCQMHGIVPDYFLAEPGGNFQVNCEKLAEKACDFDTVFICNPNNPTGALIPHVELLALCKRLPQTRFIIDESYLPFAPEQVDQSMTRCTLDNVIVLWSLSKIYGIPGLRAGFLIGSATVANQFRRYMQPWCANSLAQEAIGYLAANKQMLAEFVHKTKMYLAEEMTTFRNQLDGCGASLYPSVTPYQLIRLPQGHTAEEICERLIRDRLLIRNCSNFHGLDSGYVRISLKTPEINRMAAKLFVSAVGR